MDTYRSVINCCQEFFRPRSFPILTEPLSRVPNFKSRKTSLRTANSTTDIYIHFDNISKVLFGHFFALSICDLLDACICLEAK